MSRAASLLAFIVLSFSSIVPISALAASARETSGHWSLQPLKAPVVTRTSDDTSPIDAYVTARLATNGLALSSEADRATLIRRLSFDLIGLPPSPRETDDFVQNQFPEAYEQLVERLLASPHYGERWGRHWLDVARYTESQGFEYDRLRDNAWHYRDYVIKALNDDKPYDQFIREQIAGDVLEPQTREGIIATSLLVCGPYDQAGNKQANVTQKMITREEELDDLIGVVGQTFLGLTINCARCHAHKFDPIPQEEYYRIKSVFEGVFHGERPLVTNVELKEAKDQIAQLEKEIKKIDAEIKAGVDAGTERTDASDDAPARKKQLESERDRRSRVLKDVSYAGTRQQPAPTKRLKRGSVTTPLEVVSPGALSAIDALSSDFGLAPDAPEAERRLKLAEWMTDP